MSYGMDGWNKPGGDTISRAAAIDELNKGAWGVEWDKTLAKTMIESLPSAQPTQNTRVNSNNSLDTISRAAALEALDEINAEIEDGYGFDFERWREFFCDLPSAQPEIVRCKDCKYSSPNKVYGCRFEPFDTCENGGRMYSDDYCSRAERRTE